MARKHHIQALCQGECGHTTPHTAKAGTYQGVQTIEYTCDYCGTAHYGSTGTTSPHYVYQSKPVKSTTAQQRIEDRAAQLRAEGYKNVRVSDSGLGLTYDGDYDDYW